MLILCLKTAYNYESYPLYNLQIFISGLLLWIISYFIIYILLCIFKGINMAANTTMYE